MKKRWRRMRQQMHWGSHRLALLLGAVAYVVGEAVTIFRYYQEDRKYFR